MNLIEEARKRGYRKGTKIRYEQPFGGNEIDRVEGDYFEIMGERVVAYEYPKHERTHFERRRFDTLFDGKKWTEIVGG